MRRVMTVLLSFVLIVSLSCPACSYFTDTPREVNTAYCSDEESANIRFGQVLEAIEEQDSDVLKALFSEQALAEAEDLDESIEHLFALVQGDIVSWEQESSSAGRSTRNGKRSRQVRSWFTLTTTEDTYRFFLLDYDENKIDPELEGLYTLRAVRLADKEEYFSTWQDMKIPGVYVPEEYFAEPTETSAE